MSKESMIAYRTDYVATGIKWDTDGQPLDECDLPASVVYIGMPSEHVDFDSVEDRISQDLSDRFGFFHNGFSLSRLRERAGQSLGVTTVVCVQEEEEAYADVPEYTIYMERDDIDIDLVFESGAVITLQHRPSNADTDYKGSFDVILPDDTIVNAYTGDLAPSRSVEGADYARICNQLVLEIP